MHTEDLTPPYIPGPNPFVKKPGVTEQLSDEAQALKDKFERYVNKSNAYAIQPLYVFWRHHNILNIGEFHAAPIRRGIVPTIVKLLSNDVIESDIFALEGDHILQGDVDTYLAGNDQEAVAAFAHLNDHYSSKPFIEIIKLAKQRGFGFVFIDPRTKGARISSRYWNTKFVESVTDKYGINALKERRIIFYTGNGHALYTQTGSSLGDILIERLGKSRVVTIQLQYQGFALMTVRGESFQVGKNILSRFRSRVVYLHHPGNPFDSIYQDFFVKLPINQMCDGIIYY